MNTTADRDQRFRAFLHRSYPYRWTAIRIAIGLTAVAAVYAGVTSSGIADLLSGGAAGLSSFVEGFGKLGPIMIVALMTLAIVASPLPSAPIALVSGTLYGHAWGTAYVVLGAQLGATTAFLAARYVHPRRLAARLDNWFTFRSFDSQATLVVAVFASRLLPFVSFDLASYAAGLSPLHLWRFSVATLLGILTASFLLAHVGGEAASLDGSKVATAIALLVAAGLITFVARFGRRSSRRNR